MNNETLKALVKEQEDYIKNNESLDALLDPNEKETVILTIEKAQKLELDERRMRNEESKQLLEIEKFEYQKKQDSRDFWGKIIVCAIGAIPAIFVGGVKLYQIIVQKEKVEEAYAIDEVTTLTSPTARNLQSSLTNPKI